MFIYFRKRERETEQEQLVGEERGEGQREGDTESEVGSRLWDVSTEPNMGLEPMNCEITTWAKDRCLTDWATQVPQQYFHFKNTKKEILGDEN